MKHRHVEQRLPWNTVQMFDLVADIERYHEFLPGWTHARIVHREGNVLSVLQGIDLGILRLEFESRAVLHKPDRLQVLSSTGPFRHFQLDWQFRPDSDQGCVVTLQAGIEMNSIALDVAAGRLLDLLTQDIFRRFRVRAAQLYGIAGGLPPAGRD